VYAKGSVYPGSVRGERSQKKKRDFREQGVGSYRMKRERREGRIPNQEDIRIKGLMGHNGPS
jgi:hypothetical protein